MEMYLQRIPRKHRMRPYSRRLFYVLKIILDANLAKSAFQSYCFQIEILDFKNCIFKVLEMLLVIKIQEKSQQFCRILV